MRRSMRGLVSAFAVAAMFAGMAAEASAAPARAGVSHRTGRVAAHRSGRRYVRRSNAGPAIAGAALGLIGAATAAAAASQYDNGPYYGGGYNGGGYYGAGQGYYGPGPGYGYGYSRGPFGY